MRPSPFPDDATIQEKVSAFAEQKFCGTNPTSSFLFDGATLRGVHQDQGDVIEVVGYFGENTHGLPAEGAEAQEEHLVVSVAELVRETGLTRKQLAMAFRLPGIEKRGQRQDPDESLAANA